MGGGGGKENYPTEEVKEAAQDGIGFIECFEMFWSVLECFGVFEYVNQPHICFE